MICQKCNRWEAMPDRTRCSVCANRDDARRTELQRERRAAGLCVVCGKRTNGIARCAKHHKKLLRAQKRRRERLNKEGICRIEGCGQPLHTEARCQAHAAQKRTYDRKYRNGS